MLAPSNPVIGRRWRGDHLESQHRGVWALVEVDGAVIEGQGDPDQKIFARSSSKSLQALPLLLSGAVEQFGFDNSHIALALASHSGEEVHVQAALHMLTAAGLTEDHLQCGPSKPLYARGDQPASRLRHCCSGKHAGFLAATVAMGADPASYLAVDSPLQQQVHATLLAMTGLTNDDVSIEIDGCSAPTYCLPLRALAVGIARIANPGGPASHELQLAAAQIGAAAAEHPHMVAGSDPMRFDTAIMQVTNGQLFAKEGADGVQVIGVSGANVAFVGKCDDGSLRALWPLAAAVLADHGHLEHSAASELSQWTDTSIRNAAGDVTGHHEIVR